MAVRIILAAGATLPEKGSARAGALDLVASNDEPILIHPQAPSVLIPTGVKVDMSDHPTLAAFVIPRSGMGHKKGLVLGNTIGLIDNDYQGEIFVSAWNRNPPSARTGMGMAQSAPIIIESGDRIAQLVFLHLATSELELETVESFETATERGEGGFGSTGTGKRKG